MIFALFFTTNLYRVESGLSCFGLELTTLRTCLERSPAPAVNGPNLETSGVLGSATVAQVNRAIFDIRISYPASFSEARSYRESAHKSSTRTGFFHKY